MYLIRLDDASEHMNIENWIRMKGILDRYEIKPIYGIIPDNKDPDLLEYETVPNFWQLMKEWEQYGWIPAMHGYQHVFETSNGGVNPINQKSEFAGLSLDCQREKIRKGYKILVDNGIKPDIFFAPAHTFDVNTLRALYKETSIRAISDTIANDVYYKKPFYFIPQQSGRVRKLPFKTVTFCYHPNIMIDEDFRRLEKFIGQNSTKFSVLVAGNIGKRRLSIVDCIFSKAYFFSREFRRVLRICDQLR